MARVDNTPPINATGAYTVHAPFTIPAGSVYRCEAIIDFSVLEDDGVNVHQRYYEPVGLDTATFETDKINQINIIVLVSDNHPKIEIPSSYIASFPTAVTVPYSHMYLSVDLGLLPDGVPLQAAKDIIAAEVAKVVGVPVDGVSEHKVSLGDTVDFSEHERLESNRQQALVDRETPFAAMERMQKIIDEQAAAIAGLNEVIVQLQP